MNIYKQIESEIIAASSILITSHKSADGDSVGCSLGLLHFIEKLGKKAVVCHPDKAPDFLFWLDTSPIVLMSDNPQKVNDAISKGINESEFKTNEKKESFKLGAQNIINAFIEGGYNSVIDKMDLNIPEQASVLDKEKAIKTYINIIFLVSQELVESYQKNNKDNIVFPIEDSPRFIQDALTAYSDSFFYGVPFYLELKEFKEVQASGLQLTKSPGQVWVYLGSILLVLGIFCMIYIQEVRLWIFKKNGSKNLVVSLATNRDRIDFDQYAKKLQDQIKKMTN